MFKKKYGSWIVLFVVLILSACSNNDSSESSEDIAESSEESEMEDNAKHGLSDTQASEEAGVEEGDEGEAEDRMMVYEAHIDLETEDYDQFQQNLDERMGEHEAYMVETNIHKTERGNREGHIRLRVPQPNFDAFLTGVEDITDTIKSRNITSRDVTKSYVDLESRLKAQEEIEARLLHFLEEAEATEDLIKISQDLERVQSEIETIKGEMNYLSNQSDFSTVTLSIEETKVVVSGVDNQNLNTWEKTKQAFFNSINGIAGFLSGLFVFFIGYSPVILPLLALVLFFWWRWRKKSTQNNR